MSPKQDIREQLAERLDYDELMKCMRCGFCLPTCPTYIQTNQDEAASPRGRIALMKGVVDGLIEPDQDFQDQLDLCLGCRACEPVCPSGVKYGHLLEDARDVLTQSTSFSLTEKLVRNVTFDRLFPNQDRMRQANSLLRFYQKSGMQKLVRASNALKILPGNLEAMESILPEVPPSAMLKQRPEHINATSSPKKKVAFFSGCLMDTMFATTNDSTLTLLTEAGCEVSIPKGQGCCGALHAHGGEKASAKELAKRNIEAFEKVEADVIVTNAGGCGALLCEYDHLLKDEPEWVERAKGFAAKVKDFSEVLVELSFHEDKELALPDHTVTYQDSCHLRNVMKTSTAPRKLLQSIDGLTFNEMKDADHCCGSAGIYNITHSDMANQILDFKMQRVKETAADTIITANPGCLMQMKLGVKREGLDDSMQAVHLADLLVEALKHGEKSTTHHVHQEHQHTAATTLDDNG